MNDDDELKRHLQFYSEERYVKHGSRRYRFHRVTDPEQDLVYIHADRFDGRYNMGKQVLHRWFFRLSDGAWLDPDDAEMSF